VQVLTWNLFHGRAQPPAGRDLLAEFAAMLGGWSWDLALLQEVPPWWPPALARECGAEQRTALTSRNFGLAVRRALARGHPDRLKSNGGGCNAVLARTPIAFHRRVRLRTWPERRVAQLVRLGDGTVAANYHASTRVPLAEEELARLRGLVLDEGGRSPGSRLVLGGDLNLRSPQVAGMEHAAARDVDHVFVAGTAVAGAQVLDRGVVVDGRPFELSDHPPLLVELT
jgi:endonuclease/exonuclease/phosphatase family metal-dependent hydrolase